MSFDCVKGPTGGILELSDRVYPRGSYKCLLETLGIFLALHFVGTNIFQDGLKISHPEFIQVSGEYLNNHIA